MRIKHWKSKWRSFKIYFDLSRIEINFWKQRLEIYLPFRDFQAIAGDDHE